MPARKSGGRATPGSKRREEDDPRYLLDPAHAPRFVPGRGLQTTTLSCDTGERRRMVLSATLPGHRVPLHSHPAGQIGLVYSGHAKSGSGRRNER